MRSSIMASACIIFASLLALPFFARAQLYSDPSAEPWAAIVVTACGAKEIDPLDTVRLVQECLQKMPSYQDEDVTTLAFCNSKEERNECMELYYDKIKTCFDSEEAKDQIDVAFELQKRNVDYVCDNDQKAYKDFMADFDPECGAKQHAPDAVRCKQDVTSPDVEELFNINNCKMIKAIQNCNLEAVKSCKTMNFYNFLTAQYEAILGDDCPPKLPNGGSLITFAACLLALPLFTFML